MKRHKDTDNLWIGQSEPRNSARGDAAGGSQFFYSHKPGWRGGITREFLLHGVVSLNAPCLITWERVVYAFAQEQGLPFPACVGSSDTSVTTELVGPSVEHLLAGSNLPIALDEAEVAATILAVFRTNAVVADAGVMPFDGHLNNHLVWLENGLEGGHLEFDRTKLVDHTYTLFKAGQHRKPLWCGSQASHFPPEAKFFKHADEDAFAKILIDHGFAGESLGDMVMSLARISDGQQQRDQRWRLERAYEAYLADQQLQAALDAGAIEPHRMIQFALATCFLDLLNKPSLPVATRNAISKVASVLEPMRDPRPEVRYATLHSAADALEEVFGEPLSRSLHPWPAIDPKFLIWNKRGSSDPDPDSSTLWEPAGVGSTFSLDDLPENQPANSSSSPQFSAMRNFVKATRDSVESVNRWSGNRLRPFALLAVLLTLIMVASIRLPQTPDEAVVSARKAYVHQLAVKAESRDPKKAAAGLSELEALLRQGDPVARQEIDRITASRFSVIERKYLRRGLFSSALPITILGNAASESRLRNVIAQLQHLAKLGNEPARQWAEALLKVNTRGGQPVGRLAAR